MKQRRTTFSLTPDGTVIISVPAGEVGGEPLVEIVEISYDELSRFIDRTREGANH